MTQELTKPSAPGPNYKEERVERLLFEADRLVRAGAARLDGSTVIQPLTTPEGITATIAFDLPPEVLRPRLQLTRGEGADVDAARWTRDARRLRPVLYGSLEIVGSDEGITITWSPDDRLALSEVLSLFRGACEHLIVAAVQKETRLWQALDSHRTRGDRLRARFPESTFDFPPHIGRLHVIHDDNTRRLRAIQRDADLLSPGAGRGFLIALRLPEGETAFDQVGRSIQDVLNRRFGCELTTDDDYAHLWELDAFDDVIMFATVPNSTREFETHLDDIADIVRFCRSLTEMVWEGTPIEALVEIISEVAVEAPEEESAEARRARIWGDTSLNPVADKPSSPSAVDTAGKKPPRATQTSENEIDKLSARDVVKRLTGLDMPTDFDVFMTHPGYNPDKTMKIMCILLGISREESAAICESAPCAVIEGVTKAKATQIRTMLEGTGAKVRVVHNG